MSSIRPVPPQHWADYVVQVLVCAVAFWAAREGWLVGADATRLVLGSLTLQAVLRRRTGVGGGLAVLTVGELAADWASSHVPADLAQAVGGGL